MKKHKTGSIRLTVTTDYDIHSMVMSLRTWGRIQAGTPIRIKGQGFYIEGERSQDEWTFNQAKPGAVTADAEDGFQIFEGGLDEVTTEIL